MSPERGRFHLMRKFTILFIIDKMEVSKQITWGIPFAPADRFSWFFFCAKTVKMPTKLPVKTAQVPTLI